MKSKGEILGIVLLLSIGALLLGCTIRPPHFSGRSVRPCMAHRQRDCRGSFCLLAGILNLFHNQKNKLPAKRFTGPERSLSQSMEHTNKIACVVGPTACGKTTLGILLAQRFGGEIVSADSMQIYRGMAIGTAAPTAEGDGWRPTTWWGG